MATARPPWRTRWRTKKEVATATSSTRAGGLRPVAPAANTLGPQAGLPVVAAGSIEEISVWGPPVVAGGCTFECRVGSHLVSAASSTTEVGGNHVVGLPGVHRGCAKRARVAGPPVYEAGSTDGGSRRRLESDNAPRRRRVDETSVVRISVAGVGSEATGMRRAGQPVLCRKPAAVHERPANTPVRRTRAGVITGRAATKTREKVCGEARTWRRPAWDQRSWEKEAGKPAEWSARCRGGGREGGRRWCRGHTASRRCKAEKAGWQRDRWDV